MTHTSTEQPEALRLAEYCDNFGRLTPISKELRRLHARMQELESHEKLLASAIGSCLIASGIVRSNIDGFSGPQLLLFANDLKAQLEAAQAQRAPLTASQVAELLDEAGYSIWDMTRADFINGIRHGEQAHGIIQEK